MSLDRLFVRGRIGNLELKNRIVKSPQTTMLANPDGTVTERLVNHYKRLAEGGAGLVITEYSYVDEFASQGSFGQLSAARDDRIAGLGLLAQEVRAAGAKFGIQLVHVGRQKFMGTQPMRSATDSSWDYVEWQHGERPVPMTKQEIDDVAAAFGAAAARVVRADADLVEVHAGHGYLITNFLSPFTNTRTDDYGGSFDNRARLLLEVVASIRASIPAGFPLSIRLSLSDYEEGGIPLEESVELSRRLEAAGVDVIHMSGGHHARSEYEVSPWTMPRAVHRWGFRDVKEAVSIPVIGSGSIVEPELAAQILDAGEADFVSLGRPLFADPDWPRKAQEGRLLDIVPCIRCNDGCLARGTYQGLGPLCGLNPEQGREYRFPVEAAAERRRIAVVGGGPAGLRAAQVAADRGHAVTLYDPAPLGGALNAATRNAMKGDLAALVRHLVHQVERRDVVVRAETATAEALAAGGYDAVVVATGRVRRPFDGEIADGAVPVLHALDVEAGARLAEPVVVIGGGMTGADAAVNAIHAGAQQVTIVEADPLLLDRDDLMTDRFALVAILGGMGVELRTSARAVAIGGDGVTVETAGGGRETVAAGTVVLAVGYEPDPALAEALRTRAPELEVVIAGTASPGGAGRVQDALLPAFHATRLL